MRQPPSWTLRVIAAIDRISAITGLVATWLTLGATLLTAMAALLRYTSAPALGLSDQTGFWPLKLYYDLYAVSANMLADAIWYMFAGIVMLGAAWTLRVNAHVRVDLIFGMISERFRTIIDLLGGLFFLLPLSLLLIGITWGWAWDSLLRLEGSTAAGGLPLWPAKMLLPLGFALVGLQGCAEILKCMLALTTPYVREAAYEKPLQ